MMTTSCALCRTGCPWSHLPRREIHQITDAAHSGRMLSTNQARSLTDPIVLLLPCSL